MYDGVGNKLRVSPWPVQDKLRPKRCPHRWPWKIRSSPLRSPSIKEAKTHSVAISQSTGFHYTLASLLLFWQGSVCALDVMRSVNFCTGHAVKAHSAALPHSHNLHPTWSVFTRASRQPVFFFPHTSSHMSRLKALSLLHHALKAVYLTH